jgi:peptidoglycan/xylan/chitin deacetylase (PgdA/CDA1 family)
MKAKSITMFLLAMVMFAGLVAIIKPTEVYASSIPANRRAVLFGSITVTSRAELAAGRGWYAGMSPGGAGSFIEFDITQPGLHTWSFQLWGGDGLPDGYEFDLWMQDSAVRMWLPSNPASNALPVSLESIRIAGDTKVSNRAFASDAWWYHWTDNAMPRTIAGINFPYGRIHNRLPAIQSQNLALWQFPLGVGEMDSTGAPIFASHGTGGSRMIAYPSPTLGTYRRGDLIEITVRVGEITGGTGELYGRVAGNSTISSADVTMLRRYLAGHNPSGFLLARADVNGDGQVNQSDVTYLREYVAATNASLMRLGPPEGLNTWPAPPPRPAGAKARIDGFVANQTPLIALTFDDGPHPIYTTMILNYLRAADATATFYVNPNKFNDSTIMLIHRMIREGHDVEHHGWDHTSYGTAIEPGAPHSTGAHNSTSALADFRRTAQAIYDATGYWPWSFRAPFFEWGHAQTGNFDQTHHMAFTGCSVNTNDASDAIQSHSGGRTAIAGTVTNSPHGGMIALFHDDGGSTRLETAESVRIILAAPNLSNYRFVTVRELHEAYRNTPARAQGQQAVAHMGISSSGLQRNAIGPGGSVTALWPTGAGNNWWDRWHSDNNPWKNPIPPWERLFSQ